MLLLLQQCLAEGGPRHARYGTKSRVGEGVHVNNEEAAADEQGSTWGSAEDKTTDGCSPPPHPRGEQPTAHTLRG